MSVLTPATEVAVARVREEVASLHADLVASGLVSISGGSLSARVPGSELLVITPSQDLASEAGPESMIVCDLAGRVVPDSVGSELHPAADVAAHGRIYRHRSDAGALAYSTSPYATAWAVTGLPVPCLLVSSAERFGGEIPASGSTDADPQSLADDILASLDGHRSPAVLLRHRGVWSLGSDARDAVSVAIAVEDAARTAYLARRIGDAAPLPQQTIDRLRADHAARHDSPFDSHPDTPASAAIPTA